MNFLKILTKHFCISIIASLFFVLSLTAQEQKIGVVNFQALVESSPQFRDVMQSLAGEFQPRQREAVAKSKELEELISTQFSQELQFSLSSIFSVLQLIAFARILAVLVLPVPLGPLNKYACAIRF